MAVGCSGVGARVEADTHVPKCRPELALGYRHVSNFRGETGFVTSGAIDLPTNRPLKSRSQNVWHYLQIFGGASCRR